jgi:DNA-directed RNA polymerase sigma subunit (sigma70/sigma32)
LEEAKDARAVAIKDALRAGMSLREIGSLMGISHTRVREIANSV